MMGKWETWRSTSPGRWMGGFSGLGTTNNSLSKLKENLFQVFGTFIISLNWPNYSFNVRYWTHKNSFQLSLYFEVEGTHHPWQYKLIFERDNFLTELQVFIGLSQGPVYAVLFNIVNISASYTSYLCKYLREILLKLFVTRARGARGIQLNAKYHYIGWD